MLGGEVFQDRLAVVADANEPDALFLKPLLRLLQLDQLPFAKGSPIGRTEEEHHEPVRTLKVGEVAFHAELIYRSKCRNLVSDF
jgi:hypothetical protein